MKSPQQKKAEAYARDHVTVSEYPQSFQKQWPRKKRRVNRCARHAAARHVERVAIDPEVGDLEARQKPVRRLYKWPPVPLGERVQERLQTRAKRQGWNYFKHPYVGAEHREAFTRFLHELITTDSRRGIGRLVAARFCSALRPGSSPDGPWPQDHARLGAWLEAYFADVPDMRGRLLAWLGES